jgi:hypothetical protein
MVLLYVIILILAVIGITQVVGAFINKFVDCSSNRYSVYITTVGAGDNYEMAVRSIIEKSKWGGQSPDKILILSDNITEEAKRDIENLTSPYPYITLCDKSQIKLQTLL